MKIKQGISGFDELKYFADNGVNEVYFGLQELPSHVEDFADNVQGITSHNLAEAVDYAHSRKCGVFVAVNDINVNVYNIDKALDKMRFLMDCGVDGFIISSPEFVMKYPKKARHPEWHLSCLAMCVNRPSLEFYRDMGIRRFAIYQSITPEEAICMFKGSGMESEAFLQADEICVNFDGLCQGCGGLFGNRKFCQSPFSLPKTAKKFHCVRPGLRTDAHFFYSFFKSADWLKLVRKGTFEHRKRIFSIAKDLLSMAEKSNSEEEFWNKSEQKFLEIRRLQDGD